MKPVRFTLMDAQTAAGGYFNCGPAALCAVANLTPDEVMPHIPMFDQRHYTNPSMMIAALRSIKIPWKGVYSSPLGSDEERVYPRFGLVRIQWAGPWTKPGVPIAARYRHTHWVAWEKKGEPGGWLHDDAVFDVNAMCAGGWLPRQEWETQLVPWLLKQVEPKASGQWWPTHCWEIEQ